MSVNEIKFYFGVDNGRQTIQQQGLQDVFEKVDYLICNSDRHSSRVLSDATSDPESLSSVPESTIGYKSEYLGISRMMERELQETLSYYSERSGPISVYPRSEEMVLLGMYDREAYLVFKTAPEHRFRYRYDTEMSGTHGSLQGIRSCSDKSVPEVELVNYPNEALIRVSLVTCNKMGERYPHPHSLFIKEKLYLQKMYENVRGRALTKTGHYSDPHYVRVGASGGDFVARFEGMCIISSKKENFAASIEEKLEMRSVEQGLKGVDKKDLSRKVDEAVKIVDLDFVSLCFEAFREEDGRLVPICSPLYSEPIGNSKSANTGKLKITKINKCSGGCSGGEEIWMLVEKINKKGLVIRFFEEYNGQVEWEYCLEGDDIILHHQYAIVFKTPPYRDPNISAEVKVLMRLERSSQLSEACNFSEPITFVYEPLKNNNHKDCSLYKKESILPQNKAAHVKRPRMDSSGVANVHYKRKWEEQNSYAFSDELLADVQHGGNDFADSNYLRTRYNAEASLSDILEYLSEGLDLPPQMDGISTNIKSRKELRQMLHSIYSKFDESEIKMLTDRVNNIKFSKGKGRAKSDVGDDSKEVEDAVCTLLSLREKAVELNGRKSDSDRNERDSAYEAVVQNKPEVLREIMSSGCCWHADDDGNTPLHLSLLLRRNSCTEALIEVLREMSSVINVKNKDGKTPLHLAAVNGNVRHVKLLLESGANVNETEERSKRNALHVAVAEGNRDVAECLMTATDIKFDAEDAEGETPSSLVRCLPPSDRKPFEKLFRPSEVAKKEENDVAAENCRDVNLDELYETLNETESWRILADMWNCSYLVPSAEESDNPSKCVFACSQQLNGDIELEALRDLLDAINEKKGLVVLDGILARRFLFSKS